LENKDGLKGLGYCG